MNKRDALATFQALVASVREERMCVLQAISDEGEDIWVCCHVSGDPGDGTMAVVPLARLLSEPEVAGMELNGRVAHRPADVIHMLITSEDKQRN